MYHGIQTTTTIPDNNNNNYYYIMFNCLMYKKHTRANYLMQHRRFISTSLSCLMIVSSTFSLLPLPLPHPYMLYNDLLDQNSIPCHWHPIHPILRKFHPVTHQNLHPHTFFHHILTSDHKMVNAFHLLISTSTIQQLYTPRECVLPVRNSAGMQASYNYIEVGYEQ